MLYLVVDILYKFYVLLREFRSMRLTGNVGEMLVNVEVKIEISMLLLDIKK